MTPISPAKNRPLKKTITVLVGLFWLTSAPAQHWLQPSADSTLGPYPTAGSALKENETFFGFTGSARLNSNALTAKVNDKLLLGGHITKEEKQAVAEKLRDQNRAGGHYRYGLEFATNLDSLLGRNTPNTAFFGGLYEIGMGHIGFSRDLFRAIFFGNRSFKGNTAALDPLTLETVAYQQMELGLSKSQPPFFFGGSLSLINGKSFREAKLKKGELHTDEQATAVEFRAKGRLYRSDTNASGSFRNSGKGLSARLFIAYETKNGQRYRAGFRRMGLIRWDRRTVKAHMDSTYRFAGFELGELSNALNNGGENGGATDSLKRIITPEESAGPHSTSLPADIYVQYSARSERIGLTYSVELDHTLLTARKPRLLLAGTKTFGSAWSRLSVGVGGYGNWNLGLGAGLTIGDKFHCFVASSDLEGFMLPQRMEGRHISAGIMLRP